MKPIIGFLNLLTTPDFQLEAAFDKVEYPGFFRYSMNSDQVSLKVVFEIFECMMDKDAFEDYPDCISIGPAIYGGGGGHRYFVYTDGRIRFSKGHASFEAQELAKELKFQVS